MMKKPVGGKVDAFFSAAISDSAKYASEGFVKTMDCEVKFG
jgi:hypothetical protein